MNYNEQARTNYFKVKDMKALIAFVEATDTMLSAECGDDNNLLERWEKDPDMKVAIIAETGFSPSDEDGEDTPELVESAMEFLADDEVLVLQGNGSEGLRVFSGFAMAINNQGDHVQLSLDDIYAKAAKKFKVKVDTIAPASN